MPSAADHEETLRSGDNGATARTGDDEPMLGPISQRVARLQLGSDGAVIACVPSGWAILNERQPAAVTGASVLLPDPVVRSVNDLDAASRTTFMDDLVRLGDAVLAATGAERVNYLILCNQAPELHAHVIPRFADEEPAKRRVGPFEAYDFSAAGRVDPADAHAELLSRLRLAMKSHAV